jgi:hypothetical protein
MESAAANGSRPAGTSASIGRAAALYGAAQRSIQIGMRRFEIADDFEIDALTCDRSTCSTCTSRSNSRTGLGISRPLSYREPPLCVTADLRPELFLVEPQTAPDLARIQDTVKDFHAVDELAIVR